METQIAFSIDPTTKKTFSKNLKNQGLTTKGFFLMCIHAFNEKKIFPTLVSNSDLVDVNVSAKDFLHAMQKEIEKRT